MSTKVDIADLKLGQLNAACLMLVAKFAKVLESHDGTVIHLRDDDVIRTVVQHGKSTDNLVLQSIYLRLKTEIRNHLGSQAAGARSRRSSDERSDSPTDKGPTQNKV